MEKASLTNNLVYNDEKPAVTVLLKTPTSKEIRIALKAGQVMKEHTAPYPIIIEIFEGAINFGVDGVKQQLNKGDIITLGENVPHDLEGINDSIVRLSVSQYDNPKRIEAIISK